MITTPDVLPDAPATILRWRRSFPGSVDQAALVRRFIAALMPDCPVIDDMLLVADEFVVNALRHSKSGGSAGEFAVEVRRWPDHALVAVTDQGGPTEPAAVEADELAESGRGLRTVAALADSWGWYGNEHGRTVTAVFQAEEAIRLERHSARRDPWPFASDGDQPGWPGCVTHRSRSNGVSFTALGIGRDGARPGSIGTQTSAR